MTATSLGPAPAPDSVLSGRWAIHMDAIAQHLQTSGAHAGRCVVLVPYAQLMAQARARGLARMEGLILATNRPMLKFARQLRGRFGLPVHEVDERYSTTEALAAGAPIFCDAEMVAHGVGDKAIVRPVRHAQLMQLRHNIG